MHALVFSMTTMASWWSWVIHQSGARTTPVTTSTGSIVNRELEMSRLTSLKVVMVISLLVLAAGCEYMPFSMGELEGQPAATLSDWREVADVSIVQLETLRDGEPYSVNIWMVAKETAIYIYAGDNETQWMANLAVNPSARIQISGLIYDFSGSRVTDEEEFKIFTQAWLEKYGSDRSESTAADTFLYRFDP